MVYLMKKRPTPINDITLERFLAKGAERRVNGPSFRSHLTSIGVRLRGFFGDWWGR